MAIVNRASNRRAPDSTGPSVADSPFKLRILGALLCIAVAAIHVIDQGGMPGTQTPGYVQGLYYALEAGGALTGLVLLVPWFPVRWVLALSVAVGPMAGYILSRGPGLPDYTDDIGNWAQPLGVISLIVETALLITAVTALELRRRRLSVYRRVTQS
jgi:hypothetical protein